MPMEGERRIAIRGEADVSKAILFAGQQASEAGFKPRDANRLATVVAELTRNIIKYAGTGEVWLGIVRDGDGTVNGVEVSARDKGPGIDDVELALKDHFSSSGTLGLGLPGVRRMADEFEIDTAPGAGTRVTARICPGAHRERRPAPIARRLARTPSRRPAAILGGRGGLAPPGPTAGGHELSCAYFLRPCVGERVSGDGVYLGWREGTLFAAIIDGLGHGARAAMATKAAIGTLEDLPHARVGKALEVLHQRLSGTIGAAVGLCAVDARDGSVHYAAVGNTVVRVIGADERRVVAEGGTVGENMRNPVEHRLRLQAGGVLLMYSDGVSARFSLSDYPQLQYEGMDTVAREIIQRFGKTYDDAACIAMRWGS